MWACTVHGDGKPRGEFQVGLPFRGRNHLHHRRRYHRTRICSLCVEWDLTDHRAMQFLFRRRQFPRPNTSPLVYSWQPPVGTTSARFLGHHHQHRRLQFHGLHASEQPGAPDLQRRAAVRDGVREPGDDVSILDLRDLTVVVGLGDTREWYHRWIR